MKQKLLTLILVLTVLLFIGINCSRAQGTAFTYQGQLQNGGVPVSGNFDFTFSLFNNPGTNTGQLGATLPIPGVGVTNGLFTVTLDFGPVFNGGSTWLAIAVRTNGAANFIPLTPLQPLSPTPYAIYSPNAGTAASASSVPLSALPAAVVTNGASGVTLNGSSILTGAVALSGTNTSGPILQLGNGSNVNPSNPSLIGVIANGSGGLNNLVGPTCVFLDGTLAYITCFNKGLEIVDVSNPAAPVLSGEALDSSVQSGSVFTKLLGLGDVFETNHVAYVSGELSSAVTIMDVTNPANPKLLSVIQNGTGGVLNLNTPTGLLVDSNRLFLADFGSDSLFVFDVTNPSHPLLVTNIVDHSLQPSSTVSNMISPYHLTLSGTNLFVAARGSSAVDIFDVSNPSAPRFEGAAVDASVQPGSPFTLLGSANWVDVEGSLAYVAAGGFSGGATNVGLTIMNVSNPANPILVAQFPARAGANWAVQVSGNYAFLTSVFSNSLMMLDVSNPANPFPLTTLVNGVGGVTNLNGAQDLALAGGKLYVTAANSGMVGIYNPTPSVALDVNGNVLANNNLIVAGNVGIGTNAAGSPLVVSGASSANGSIRDGVIDAVQTGGTVNGGAIYGSSLIAGGQGVIGEADVPGLGGSFPVGVWGISTASNGVGVLAEADSPTGLAGEFMGNVQVIGAGSGPALAVSTSSSTGVTSNSTAKLRLSAWDAHNWTIQSVGNFTGAAAANIVGTLQFADGSTGVTNLTLTPGGNVGIGTFTPAAPLTVVGSNSFPHVAVVAASNAPFGAFLSIDATSTTNGKDYLIFATGNKAGEGQGKLVFLNHTDNTYSLCLTSNGNAGIGTLSPFAPLTVIQASNSTSGNTSIVGVSSVPGGNGLMGEDDANSNLPFTNASSGVFGVTQATNGSGVSGWATATTGTNIGVYGLSLSPRGYGGYFAGQGYFSGNLGLGTVNPDRPLAITGSGANGEWISLKDTNGITRWHINNGVGGLNFAQTGVADARLFLSTNGGVGIGTLAPDALLSVNGTADKPGGGSWATFSDARLKDLGASFTHGLDDLDAIQPIHYHYKANNPLNLPTNEYVGVVAQQVQKTIPEAVQSTKDGYLTVNNDPIIWTMLNAIKELKAKDEQLKTQDDELKAQNAELKQRLERLEATVATGRHD